MSSEGAQDNLVPLGSWDGKARTSPISSSNLPRPALIQGRHPTNNLVSFGRRVACAPTRSKSGTRTKQCSLTTPRPTLRSAFAGAASLAVFARVRGFRPSVPNPHLPPRPVAFDSDFRLETNVPAALGIFVISPLRRFRASVARFYATIDFTSQHTAPLPTGTALLAPRFIPAICAYGGNRNLFLVTRKSPALCGAEGSLATAISRYTCRDILRVSPCPSTKASKFLDTLFMGSFRPTFA